MPKFDYKKAEKTAAELIVKFGQTTQLYRYDTAYDPVTGSASGETALSTDINIVSLPASKGTVQAFDNKIKEASIAGKLRFFYIAAKDILFTPQPGDYILFEGSLWDVMGSTPLNPAGTALVFNVGCKAGGKVLSDLP